MPLLLQLHGPPGLILANGNRHVLAAREAALLAWLHLEGPTPRAALAGRLWPGGDDARARTNLRQTLRRLKTAAGAGLLDEDEHGLRLAPAVQVAGAGDGRLLGPLEFDDAPDLAAWLAQRREAAQRDQLREQLAAARAHLADGRLDDALAAADALLALEPAVEEAHRVRMEAFYLRGDRAAAIAAWDACRDALRSAFGIAPSAPTNALGQLVLAGADAPATAPRALPLALRRPPRLVGREAAWAAMEAAWQRGQLILVAGPAGSGKTRLVEDFAAAKGRTLRIEGRPGDPGVPYASVARNQRRVMALRPGLSPDSPEGLPPWVWQQARRLTPELGSDGAAPGADGAVEPAADKLRFFEGVMAVYRHCIQGLAALVVDDLHFYDDASIELSTYAIASTVPLGAGMPHHVVAYREEELSPRLARDVDRMLAQGVAALVRLEPLAEDDLREMVASLPLPPAPQLAEELRRFTGGHPLFVLETVRHLHQTGQLAAPWNGRLPGSGRLVELTARRLAQLSPAALNLARAAAVLGSDFGFETVCEVVGESPFTLAPAWQELAAAQFVSGERFSHDLLHEAVLAGLPEAVARWLHRCAAAVRERQGADPARIARHWQAAGEPAAAVPWLRRAAERSRALGLADEAQAFEREAAATGIRRRPGLS